MVLQMLFICCTQFFWKTKSSNYQDLINEFWQVNTCWDEIWASSCIIWISDTFPDHLGDVSEEQSERFHKDFKIKEDRYQGWRDTHMIADYCCSQKQDCPSKSHDRKSLKHKFLNFVNHDLLQLLKMSFCFFCN